MDELEILKKDWQKKGEELPKLSYNDIYKMIWKKSSSIVKWILIISILELILPNLVYLIPGARENLDIYNQVGLSNFFIVLQILSYLVVFYFIYQFYKRYKEISVLDDSKTLMKNIIKTRKTVKHYIIFSLSLFFFVSVVFAIAVSFNPEIIPNLIPNGLPDGVSLEKMQIILAIGFIVMGLLFTCVVGFIYFLLYGILLRKLKKNYIELKRMEV